jgi:branched-chain amino acid transport system ATP-binding protein
MNASAPILEIRDVVKDFGGIRAVNGCSFQVQKGTITGLIGPNGAGKTTLFNLITGFLPCTGGQILFQGKRIDRLAPHEVFRRGIVRTFQIPRELKRMTVLENLMLVPGNQVGEKIWSSSPPARKSFWSWLGLWSLNPGSYCLTNLAPV